MDSTIVVALIGLAGVIIAGDHHRLGATSKKD
jgi:hypothetical protein